MSSEKYGVSIMKGTKVLLFVAAVMMTICVIGCGSDESEVVQIADTTTAAEERPEASLVRTTEVPASAGNRAEDWAAIVAMVDEVITRLSYGDKAGLYENEFRYLREQETFDEYLKHGEVSWANADSMEYIEIVDIEFFGRDSAMVEAIFHMTNAGEDKASPMPLMAYYHEGRWIKPYMSQSNRQHDYDELIRQADDSDDW